MTVTYAKSLELLRVHLSEYRPQLERALAAIRTLETAELDSDAFSSALADLHVCATILQPYSEGMIDAIDQFVEDLPDEDEN